MPPATRPPQPQPVQPEFDFDAGLPAGRQSFGAWELAGYWAVSVQHVINLVEAGEFGDAPVDLATKPGKSRATRRIPRAAVLAFLHRRKFKPAA